MKEGIKMMRDETAENYLKTIYQIQQRKGCVYSHNLAEELNVSKATVCRHVQNMKTAGYLVTDGEKSLILTEKGRSIAEEVLQRFEFFRELLLLLGISDRTAGQDACKLEHAVCMESFYVLRAYFQIKSAENEVSQSMKNETIDNCLKTLYLIQKQQGSVNGNDLAESLSISKVTACMHIRHLIENGYVERNSRNKIVFTEKGIQRAEAVLEKYEFFKAFLQQIGIDEEKATQDAEKLEHAVCPESFSALQTYCKLGK